MVLRIFLVEDSATIRDSLIEMLQELLPATVIGWAATEQEAIALLTQLQDEWDVALVDLFLLQGSGLGVVHAMKQRPSRQRLSSCRTTQPPRGGSAPCETVRMQCLTNPPNWMR